ncbi:MAG: helix-turn-helix domain-containing protein [Planctomycetota bacterium]
MSTSRLYEDDIQAIVQDLRAIFGGDYPPSLRPLADAITAIRVARFGKRSKSKVANAAGIDASILSRYESGEIGETETEKLYAVAWALGVPLDRIADIKLPDADAQIAVTARRLLTDQIAAKTPEEFAGLLRFEDERALRFGIPLGWQLGSLDFFRYFKIEQAVKHFDRAKSDVLTLLKIDGFPHELDFEDVGETINFFLAHYGVENKVKHAAICLGMSGAREAYAAMYLTAAEEAFDDAAKIELRSWGLLPLKDIPTRIVPNREAVYLALRERGAKTHRELLDFVMQVRRQDK